MPTNVVLERNAKESWDFQLTGGASFKMPLTIFDVKEGGIADQAGLRLGDYILKINDQETDDLTLEQAHELIDEAEEIMNLMVTHLEDQEDVQQEAAFEKLRVDVSELDLKPPQPKPNPELAMRKCWHPIMLDTNPPPIIEETTGNEEAPHKKLMRNLREAMDKKKIKNASPEVRHTEKKRSPPKRAPPPCPVDEDVPTKPSELTEEEISMAQQLRSMKLQLEALSALPAVLQQSLSMVSQNLNKMLPAQLRQPEKEPSPDMVDSEFTDEERYLEDEDVYEYEQDDDSSREMLSEGTEETYSERDRSESVEYIETIHEVVDEEEDEYLEEEIEEEPEPEPEPTPEELAKIEKLRKLKELNRVWPWSDEIKPVYKISQRYQVPHSKLFSSRIKKLEAIVPLKKQEMVE